MIAFVVFDLDGTLVDSLRDIADSANEVLRQYGYAAHSEEAIGGMVGEGAGVLIARAFAAAGAPVPSDALERFLQVYDGRLVRHTRLYDGMLDTIHGLLTRVALGVLTNKPRAATGVILRDLGLAQYFADRVIGGDGPLPRKPSPDGLRSLMAAAGVTPETTLMVGDSVIDVLTARAAGTRACLARYGFGFSASAMQQLGPNDVVIDRPLGLLAYV
jgi:phosphoglycolate phosphatase